MAVTEGTIEVPAIGKRLDTTKVTQTDGTVAHREAVGIADPEVLAARAAVKATNALGADYGLIVRDPRLDDVVISLKRIADLLEGVTFQLNLLTEFDA